MCIRKTPEARVQLKNHVTTFACPADISRVRGRRAMISGYMLRHGWQVLLCFISFNNRVVDAVGGWRSQLLHGPRVFRDSTAFHSILIESQS